MKYKLLVLDVDGTLLNDAKEISKRTLAALLKVQQMGVRIVLASGRPTYGLMPLAKSLELGNYGGFILSYNGCQIINAQNGEILFERRINPEMLPYLEKRQEKIISHCSLTMMIRSLLTLRRMNISRMKLA